MDVEVGVEATHHENLVHVGGNDLRPSLAPGGASGEQGPAFEDVLDQEHAIRARRFAKHDPVADRGGLSFMAQLARQTSKTGRGLGPYFVAAPVLGCDTGRNHSLEAFELFSKKRVET